MIFLYFLAFICGSLTKFTDNLVDNRPQKRFSKAAVLAGISYGLVAGFLSSTSQVFATLATALAIAMLLSGKIDARPHQAGLAALFATALFLGIPGIDFFVLVLLAALAFADEALNDFADRAAKKGLVKKIVGLRPSMEIGTLAIGFLTGSFAYFFAIFSFDLAYHAIEKIMQANAKRK